MPTLETSLILDKKCLLIPVHEGNNQAHKTYFTSPSPMRCPTGLSHEIGPFSCRGPLCLREWMRARQEASRTFLPFFSILNDGNQRIAGSRLWVPLLGLKTGKHASCQHRFHRTLLVVSFVSVSKVLPDFLSHSCIWRHCHFGKLTRAFPCWGSTLRQASGNPKALCMYRLVSHNLKPL